MTKSSVAIHPAAPQSPSQLIPWHSLDLSTVLARNDVDPQQGLSNAQAARQQERFGKNELKAKQGRPLLWMFLIQFKNPLLYILLIAGAVKAFMGSWIEAGVITGVAILNALIAFTQESKAESAIKALASSVTTEAMVRRNGGEHQNQLGIDAPGLCAPRHELPPSCQRIWCAHRRILDQCCRAR